MKIIISVLIKFINVIFTNHDLIFGLQYCGAFTKLDADLKVVDVTEQRTWLHIGKIVLCELKVAPN